MSATEIVSTEVFSEQTDRAVLITLLENVAELQRTHNEILTLVTEIKTQVNPMLESLSKSPILKMMGI